eukprot:CAMPEP_0172567628 /NCGR_PEP_ID=MMETSP1067-20121228/116618_1 /TAXON_ID=265564 ORGANISM="Thalassiosira punctigera, Strain Tpunct2005C2" /NCGR_SAMPLE_ID=MMETSP1067 /ASSEMBLY_ACC=CAM_ASM_000444 /LENGTH=70 /DNA_ID=CAMNT_0013359027 /DNA_START=6 /DNA_END=215 /DNA_ORIENTATION=+
MALTLLTASLRHSPSTAPVPRLTASNAASLMTFLRSAPEILALALLQSPQGRSMILDPSSRSGRAPSVSP